MKCFFGSGCAARSGESKFWAPRHAVACSVTLGFCFWISAATASTRVVAWGSDSYGQIDVPPGLTNVVAIAAGACADHSLALKANGTVVVWGYTNLGQANVPAGLSNVVAVGGAPSYSLALKSDGRVVAWGTNYYSSSSGGSNYVLLMDPPLGLTNAVAIAAGFFHALALKPDGTVVAWG